MPGSFYKWLPPVCLVNLVKRAQLVWIKTAGFVIASQLVLSPHAQFCFVF